MSLHGHFGKQEQPVAWTPCVLRLMLSSLQTLKHCSPEATAYCGFIPMTPSAALHTAARAPCPRTCLLLPTRLFALQARLDSNACLTIFLQLTPQMLMCPCVQAIASTGQAMLSYKDAQLPTVKRALSSSAGARLCWPSHAVLHTASAAGYQLQTLLPCGLLQGCQPAQPQPCCLCHPSVC